MTQHELNAAIDHLIAHPRDDDEGRYALVTAILGAMLIVPSGSDPAVDGSGLTPVVVDHQGSSHVVVFNSIAAAKTMRHLAQYGLTMRGREVIARVAPSHGLLLVSDGGLLGLPATLLAAVRAAIASGRA